MEDVSPKRNTRYHIIRSGCLLRTKIRCGIIAMIMFVVSFRNVCLYLFLQLVTGKSLDLHYGYQEIDDVFSDTNQEEVKNLEFDRISDDAIEEICKHFKVTIHIKEPEKVINCLEPIDRSRSVILMKRDAEELEGSGDIPGQNEEGLIAAVQNKSENITDATLVLPEDKVSVLPEDKVSVLPEDKVSVLPEDKVSVRPEDKVSVPPESKVEVPPEEVKPIEQTLISSEKPETPTENPGSFHGGFDHILKNTPRGQNNDSKDIEGNDIILKATASNDQVNLKPGSTSDGEEAKTGESQEQPTAASPNSMLLIIIAALGVIGALAFVYNFVKSKRESKEIDEIIRLEMEGKELKEMKPLMTSPLTQNGTKSMEYIDADPQIQVPTETRVEVNRDHNSE